MSTNDSSIRDVEMNLNDGIPRMQIKNGVKIKEVPAGEDILLNVIYEKSRMKIPSPSIPIEYEEQEPFFSMPIVGFIDEEVSTKVHKIILNDQKVRALLGDRFESISTSPMMEKGNEVVVIKHIFYEYSNNTAIEVIVDLENRTVLSIEPNKYQPPPTENELEKAIQLAAQDTRISTIIKSEKLEGSGILVTMNDKKDSNYDHRLFDIRFGVKESRLPSLKALVDISTEEVLSAGPIGDGK
jgi:hypothetical protein